MDAHVEWQDGQLWPKPDYRLLTADLYLRHALSNFLNSCPCTQSLPHGQGSEILDHLSQFINLQWVKESIRWAQPDLRKCFGEFLVGSIMSCKLCLRRQEED